MVHVLRIPHDGWFPVVVLNVADKVNSKMEMQLWVEIILFQPPGLSPIPTPNTLSFWPSPEC